MKTQESVYEDDFEKDFNKIASYPQVGAVGIQNSNLIDLAMKTDDLIIDLDNSLRGKGWDTKENKYVQIKEPIINDDGANKIISMIVPIFNRNSTFSNLSTDKIMNICKDYESDLNDVFFLRWEDYWENMDQVESNWKSILITTGATIFAALSRAQAGEEKNLLGGNINFIQRSNTGSNQPDQMQNKESNRSFSLSKIFR